MEQHSIDFSNKSLNYIKFKELFEELKKVENIDNIIIDIKYIEKNRNSKREISKSFDNIEKLLEYLKELSKIDEINVIFYSHDDRFDLKYNHYTEGWRLEYKTENNISKSIICTLNNYFKPNYIKNLLFHNIYILWSMFGGLCIGYSINFYNAKDNEIIKRVSLYILIFLFFILLVISIYKAKKRKRPYVNNKFWETHKVEIVQNIIFYFLGVVTPYVISWIINVMK